MRCHRLALLAVFSLVLLAGCGRHDRSPTADAEDESQNSQTLGVIKGHLDFETTWSPSSAPKFESPQLAEVEVYAESIETSDTYPGEPVEDNGDYIIKRLPAGKYKVIARTENGIYGGILTEGDGTLEVEVAAGKTKEIQQTLFLSTKGRISGRVVLVGPDGKRLSETGVMEVFIPGKSFGSCWTTRKGEFTFYYIPAGRYPIVADYKGDKVTIVEDVEVKLGRETPLGEILMHSRESGGAVFGVVTASWSPPWLKANSFPCSPPPKLASTDKTMPAALKPISGAKVRVYQSGFLGKNKPEEEDWSSAVGISTDPKNGMDEGGSQAQAIFETITDENGKYRIEGIPAGDFYVAVSAEGFEGQERAIIIKPDKELHLDFSLVSKPTASIYGQAVEGKEDNASNYGLPGVEIALEILWGTERFTTATDRSGRYRIYGIPGWPGGVGIPLNCLVPYAVLTASKPGYKSQKIEIFDPLKLGEQQEVDFNLELIELKLDLEVDTGLASGVGLVLSVTNPASVPVTIFFSSGHTHDFSIYDASGELVWEWSHGKVFIMIALLKTFKPGETTVYKDIWDGRSNEGEVVPAGRYTVIGRLASKPAWKTEPVEFDFEPGQGPQLTYSNSGCLSNRGEPVKAKDEIIAEVKGNEVYVTHRNAWYNCCLEEIKVELEQEGNLIKLIETAILEGSGCRCMCLYDVSAAISDLPAGEYVIQVLNEDQGLLGEVTVTVP